MFNKTKIQKLEKDVGRLTKVVQALCPHENMKEYKVDCFYTYFKLPIHTEYYKKCSTCGYKKPISEKEYQEIITQREINKCKNYLGRNGYEVTE